MIEVDGLGEVVVEAGLGSLLAVGLLAVSRERDQVDIVVFLSNSSGKLIAIEFGQADVDEPQRLVFQLRSLSGRRVHRWP